MYKIYLNTTQIKWNLCKGTNIIYLWLSQLNILRIWNGTSFIMVVYNNNFLKLQSIIKISLLKLLYNYLPINKK